jgi:pimeloyl-ACP methyl ester carboxylesterase
MRGRAGVALAAAGAAALALALSGGTSTAQASGTARDGKAASGMTRIVVKDIVIKVRHQQPVSAYLVKPEGRLRAKSSAGVLWLHWLGQIHNDRSEFLPEAITMAQQGVVSVLPQGYFPWVPDPVGTQADVTMVRNQVNAMQAALDRLISTRGADPSRIAVVGHDYGAMYGSLLADRDHRVSVLVMEAADSTWCNWFATFWLGLEGQERADYCALFDGLDPVEHTSRLGSHVLFQWAGDDFFIPTEVQDAFAATSPDAQVLVYPNADHQLTDAALADRDAFLADQLGLPAS